jgi:hypothetical protein
MQQSTDIPNIQFLYLFQVKASLQEHVLIDNPYLDVV